MEASNLSENLLGNHGDLTLSVSEIKEITRSSEGPKLPSKITEEKYHGLGGLLKSLQTGDHGISSSSVAQRQSKYGINLAQAAKPCFCSSFWKIFRDTSLILSFSILAASIFLDYKLDYFSEDVGWLLTVFLFLVFIIVCHSVHIFINKLKKKNLRSQHKARISQTEVVRDGTRKHISSIDVVVGDLIVLKSGFELDVDVIGISGRDLYINQQNLTGEDLDIHLEDATNRVILSGSLITNGDGHGVVLNVGVNAFKNSLLSAVSSNRQIKNVDKKLISISEKTGVVGFTVSLIILVALVVFTYKWSYDVDHLWVVYDYINDIFIFICFVIFLTPDSLIFLKNRLTITAASKLLNLNIYVKNPKDLEDIGSISHILIDKTGVLTENSLKVSELCIGKADGLLTNPEKTQICQEVLEYLGLQICFNTTATYSAHNGGTHSGQTTDIALLKLANQWGFDQEKTRNQGQLKAQFPFNSATKLGVSVIEYGGKYYAFAKGAVEQVLPLCSKHISLTGHTHNLDETEKNEINEKVVKKMTNQSMRVIGMSYKIMTEKNYNKSLNEDGSFNVEKIKEKMILLGIAGIDDHLRAGVPENIKKLQSAGLNVVMITGDNKEAAVHFAKKSGILQENYQGNNSECEVLSGSELGQILNAGENNMEKQLRLKNELKVLYRSNPEQKFKLVESLKSLDAGVSVIGDATSDLPAIVKSDLGISSMSCQTKSVIERSKVLIPDFSLSSLVAVLSWGRHISTTLSKIVQFQLTFSISCGLIGILWVFIFEYSPFTSTQLLWLYIFFSVLAPYAFIYDFPSSSQITGKPQEKTALIFNQDILRNVVGQVLFQLLVAGALAYQFAHLDTQTYEYFWFSYENDYEWTAIFYAFFIMQLFNLVNCRRVSCGEFNVFEGIHKDYCFVLLFVLLYLLNLVPLYCGTYEFDLAPLNWKQHLLFIGIGTLGLVFGILFRFVPGCLFSCRFFRVHGKNDSLFLSIVRRKIR